MNAITASIGKFDPDTRSVPVTFTSGDTVHKRSVNAVLNEDGSYDKAGTKARVDEVGLGVAQKIALGVLTNPPREPEAPVISPQADE